MALSDTPVDTKGSVNLGNAKIRWVVSLDFSVSKGSFTLFSPLEGLKILSKEAI